MSATEDKSSVSASKEELEKRYQDGEKHSHKLSDPKDTRRLADRAKAEQKLEAEQEEAAKHRPRPTDAARAHGNEPSKGAKIDEEIENEEHEYLKRKGKI